MRLNNIFKVCSILLLVVLLLIWQQSSNGVRQLDSSTRVDEVVQIKNDLDTSKLNAKDKREYYDELDKVIQTTAETKPIGEYSNMIEVSTMEEIKALKDNSGSHKELLYFGSNTCSYCKALTPKISQLAVDNDIQITFVDMSKIRPANEEELKNNLAIMGEFNLSTVPLLVQVQRGKIVDTANQLDSMYKLERLFIK